MDPTLQKLIDNSQSFGHQNWHTIWVAALIHNKICIAWDIVALCVCGVFLLVGIIVPTMLAWYNREFFGWMLLLGVIAVFFSVIFVSWYGQDLTQRKYNPTWTCGEDIVDEMHWLVPKASS